MLPPFQQMSSIPWVYDYESTPWRTPGFDIKIAGIAGCSPAKTVPKVLTCQLVVRQMSSGLTSKAVFSW